MSHIIALDPSTVPYPVVRYNTATVDGHKVFYRDAGHPKAASILLLHGVPTSSHMFRDLIPVLSDRYHVVAQTCRALASPTRPIGVSSPTPSTPDRSFRSVH